MKITFVTPSMNFGGAERVMSLLANYWVENGIQVDLVVMNDSQQVAYFVTDRVGMYFTQSPRFNKVGNLSRLIKALRNVLKDSRPDIVVSFFSSTLVFAKLALWGTKIPLIYSERNDPHNNIKGIKAKTFQWAALNWSKKVVFQTVGARDYYGKLIRNKGTIILNPFDPSNLPDMPRDREKKIVSVGRLCEQKNQAMQIRAFEKVVEKHPDYRLEIYGEGPLRNCLEKQIADCCLHDKVELKGSHKDVLKQISNAEIFLFSSNYEGLPNAVIEAMALGLPCICTKCSPGGAEALIQSNDNGVLVEIDDAEQMATEIIRLIENPDEREKIGTEAMKIVDKLNIGVIGQQWVKVINSVVV